MSELPTSEQPTQPTLRERFGYKAALSTGALALASIFALSGCGGGAEARPSQPPVTAETAPSQTPSALATASPETSPPAVTILDNPVLMERASQIISTFEHSTLKIQYDDIQNLGDGRGFTAGRAGFCSGTGDLLEVVQEYSKKSPGNPLEKYLPALNRVNNSDSTKGLKGFAKAWKKSNHLADGKLHKAQDTVFNELYAKPAMHHATQVGIQTPLGELIILDTIIQHGEGEDVDGLPNLINLGEQMRGRIPPQDPNHKLEKQWLTDFLKERRTHLNHAADPDTRKEWKKSADRVEALQSLVNSGNFALDQPIDFFVYGDHFKLPALH